MDCQDVKRDKAQKYNLKKNKKLLFVVGGGFWYLRLLYLQLFRVPKRGIPEDNKYNKSPKNDIPESKCLWKTIFPRMRVTEVPPIIKAIVWPPGPLWHLVLHYIVLVYILYILYQTVYGTDNRMRAVIKCMKSSLGS